MFLIWISLNVGESQKGTLQEYMEIVPSLGNQ